MGASSQEPFSAAVGRPSAFVSYSHRKAVWLVKLRPNLDALTRERGLDVDFWDDTRLRLGSNWETEPQDALRRARAAVSPISTHFHNFEYVATKELPITLESARDTKPAVVALIVAHCRYTHQHKNRMLIVSIGTGKAPLDAADVRTDHMDLLYHAKTVPDALMNAATVDWDSACRTLGHCQTGDELDCEVGTMVNDDPRQPTSTGTRFVTYVRYNALRTREGLDALGLRDIHPAKVRMLDAVENIPQLSCIGQELCGPTSQGRVPCAVPDIQDWEPNGVNSCTALECT